MRRAALAVALLIGCGGGDDKAATRGGDATTAAGDAAIARVTCEVAPRPAAIDAGIATDAAPVEEAAAPLRPRVQVREVQVVGGLSRTRATEQLRKQEGALLACVERGRPLTGQVTLDLSLDEMGGTTTAHVKGPDDGLARCWASHLRTVKFPVHRAGGAQVHAVVELGLVAPSGTAKATAVAGGTAAPEPDPAPETAGVRFSDDADPADAAWVTDTLAAALTGAAGPIAVCARGRWTIDLIAAPGSSAAVLRDVEVRGAGDAGVHGCVRDRVAAVAPSSPSASLAARCTVDVP